MGRGLESGFVFERHRPPSPSMAHLAILARLELLHASPLLRLSGRPEESAEIHQSVEHPNSVLSLPEDEEENSGQAWAEVAGLLRVLGDELREGQCAFSGPGHAVKGAESVWVWVWVWSESLRIPLGDTSLPSALSDLLRFALDTPFLSSFSHTPSPLPSCPQGKKSQAVVEICRVAANLCFDCGRSSLPPLSQPQLNPFDLLDLDGNRTILLENSFPQTLIILISVIVSSSSSNLSLFKSALGALLNISLNHGSFTLPLLAPVSFY